MATVESSIADLTTATTALLQAVNVQKAVLDAAASTATTQAAAATGGATTVTTALAQAIAARDQAVGAWNASMAPAESLGTINQAIHSGSIVRAIAYDTSRDSDGGAWRKRTSHTTWYNETVNGVWRGQRANEGACRAVSGAAAGDYYQNITDGKFYVLVGGAGQVEVFRGNSREFPALAAVVAEAGRLVIYDLTVIGAPMWRVWRLADLSNLSAYAISCVAAINGELFIGHAAGANINYVGLDRISLIADRGYGYRTNTFSGLNAQAVSPRAACAQADWTQSGSFAGLVNVNVNDLAVAVFPGAPVDAATGLPVPTVAVGTDGGVSVIKHDGAVASDTNPVPAKRVRIVGKDLFTFVQGLSGFICVKRNFCLVTGAVADNFGTNSGGDKLYRHNTGPALFTSPSNNAIIEMARNAFGFGQGLHLLSENLAAPANGMVAKISNAYNTGWMIGDIRGCWLADTVAETITVSDLVTNGDFSAGLAGWAVGVSGTLSIVAGALRVTNSSITAGYAYQALATVAGRTYTLSATRVGGTGVGGINIGTAPGDNSIVSNSTASQFNFIATGATTYLTLHTFSSVTGEYFNFDNISVKLVVADRSVKNNCLALYGGLTKAPVAAGAQLCGWSGWLAANLLEQPYSSNFDPGTGVVCMIAWVKIANNSALSYTFDRRDSSGRRYTLHKLGGSGTMRIHTHDGVSGCSVDNPGLPDNQWSLVVAVRNGASGKVYINDFAPVSGALNAATLSGTDAQLKVGVAYDNSAPFGGSIALARITFTEPTADQVAQMYRDELALFQPGAQCTLAGHSSAVTALGYDEGAAALHVGTSWGRSTIRGLVRFDSEATTVGSITALSGSQGAILQGGAAGGRFYQPALLLRDELNRSVEAARVLGSVPVFFDVDASSGQTAFAAPRGYTVKAVYLAGVLKRAGATKDYTVAYDGYVETVNFAVAPGASAWVSVMCVRS